MHGCWQRHPKTTKDISKCQKKKGASKKKRLHSCVCIHACMCAYTYIYASESTEENILKCQKTSGASETYERDKAKGLYFVLGGKGLCTYMYI